jgi:predicted nucleic acid binding AN1-type Zn finger protein
MKKFSTSLLAIAVASLFSAGVMFAADKTETKVAGCCTKAKADGKTCAHACCVEAAKAGNNCTKCGGAGKIETKK